MDAKAPISVSAVPICQGVEHSAISRHDTPIPAKKMIIMMRRPHRSPSLPARIEPVPNMNVAPKL